MSGWTSDELDTIGTAAELNLASVRPDGTLPRPATIGVVREDDDVYVRSVNGRGSSWFRGAQTTRQAHINAGGVERDVGLIEPPHTLQRCERQRHPSYTHGPLPAPGTGLETPQTPSVPAPARH